MRPRAVAGVGDGGAGGTVPCGGGGAHHVAVFLVAAGLRESTGGDGFDPRGVFQILVGVGALRQAAAGGGDGLEKVGGFAGPVKIKLRCMQFAL